MKNSLPSLSRREVCGLLAGLPIAAAQLERKQLINLSVQPRQVRLEAGEVSYRFNKQNESWAFDSVWVRGRRTAVPLSRADSFFLGGGEARTMTVAADSEQQKAIRFSGIGTGTVSFRVSADDHLPRISVQLEGVETPACAWRTVDSTPQQRGAWATRGETASDAEGREVFVDGSGRLVFGHSTAGSLDAAYVIQAEVLDNLNQRGKSMQPSGTFFKSGRTEGPGGAFGYWQIRMGAKEPKQFHIVFDRDLGGRLHDVCEKYYADAVDSQVDLASVPSSYDPYLALERMPLRLSCPESLIPNYGWHMEEYFPGYAKFLAMQKLVLPRDSWPAAFRIQEQRDLNLRTNYDNYARGMANLAFALNRISDPRLAAYERLVPRRDSQITRRRDIIVANGTAADRQASVQVRFLEPGRYRVAYGGRELGAKTSTELEQGIAVSVPKNAMRRIQVSALNPAPPSKPAPSYDSSVTYLSDLAEAGAQRGIGLPVPTFQKDRSFRGHPITLNGATYAKGLGLAANTVIVYDLDGKYRTLAGILGVDDDAAAPEGPKPSVYFTLFVDGRCKFTSGATYRDTPPHRVEVDVRGARIVVLRMSGNWDDNGNLTNDMASFAEARLIGKAV